MKLNKIGPLVLVIVIAITITSGCATYPPIPTLNENEAFKYERKYLAEYEQLKNKGYDQSVVKWIQPTNKKIPCKVYVGISKTEDRTLDENYKIYWDGDCKNGYANGLGREFERGTVLNMDALAIYHGKPTEPEYYIYTYNLDNRTQEGDISNRYFVETTINEDNINFDINYRYGFFGSAENPYNLITTNSPFSDDSIYYKQYPNFSYAFYDMSNNEFKKRRYQFNMFHNGKANGFGFRTTKAGTRTSGETTNGTNGRIVILPNSYFTKISQIDNEVKEAGQKAINAQKYALKVKKQYMSRVCKESVSVNFINNEEYKNICNESEYYSNLKEKIDVKLAQINKQKQQKREQQNQQKLINAQVRQANAAEKSARANRDAAYAASRNANATENRAFQEWMNKLPVPITFGPASPWRSY